MSIPQKDQRRNKVPRGIFWGADVCQEEKEEAKERDNAPQIEQNCGFKMRVLAKLCPLLPRGAGS